MTLSWWVCRMLFDLRTMRKSFDVMKIPFAVFHKFRQNFIFLNVTHFQLYLFIQIKIIYINDQKFNSHAIGMAAVRPFCLKIDFASKPLYGSAALFLIIILKFNFTPIFEVEIHEKKSLTPKKILFWKVDFHNLIYIHQCPWAQWRA